MLGKEDNEILTRVGPGTPMGALMRRYWVPVVLSSELDAGGRTKRIQLLGERMVAFRATQGEVGLLGEYCSHRRASLYFGRIEKDGLRCCYHGWKYALDGQCLEMPNESPETDFKHAVKHPAYPCEERGGIVWAYMGDPAHMTGLPDFEWVNVPDNQRFISKYYQDNNYFQALEGGIDSSHISFLHAPLDSADQESLDNIERAGFGVDTAVGTTDRSPRFEVVDTNYGVMIGARRNGGDERYYWRITQFIMPFYTMPPPQDKDPILHSHAWVPADDGHLINWTITWHPTRPLREEELISLNTGLSAHITDFEAPTNGPYGDIRPLARRAEDYGMDWEAHRTRMFCGMPGFGMQDRAMTESQGAIFDRTLERLGTSDTAIIQVRKCLIESAKMLRDQGDEPPGLDPALHHIRAASAQLPKDAAWVEAMKDQIQIIT